MKTKKYLSIFILLWVFVVGCNVQQVSEAYNMTKCDYSFRSVDNLTLAGVRLDEGLSPVAMLQFSSLLTGTPSSIPLNMTLNINVKNPQSGTARLQGLSYSLSIDDIDFTQGSISNTFSISSGATEILPIHIALDLATLIKQNSKDAMVNIARNIAGLSGEKSKVTLRIRPSFVVGSNLVTSPVAYPVTFYLGGK